MNKIKLALVLFLVSLTFLSGCNKIDTDKQSNISEVPSDKPVSTPQTNSDQSKQKISPDEAKKLILKFRNFKIEELNLDSINDKTGEYYITREPGSSKGNAGVTYRVNPISGDVFNHLTNELEFNLFSNGGIDVLKPQSPMPNKIITVEDIKGFFLLSKDEFLQKTGNGYKLVQTGAEGSFQGYNYKEFGLTFVFDEDKRLGFINCDASFSINGVKPGMTFSEIKQKLGDKPIKDTWVETPANKAYELRYDFDGFTLRFMSFKNDGSESGLTILRKK